MHRLFFACAISTTIIMNGCAVGDFVAAYFNTYYNAKKVFDEAEQEVLNPAVAPGSTRTEKSSLAPFDVPAQAKTKFASVIEKCSKLLQYHPDSKLVDDALLLIGKSYYYQNEHQSAERKFNEILSSYPESDLRFEATLLLAQSSYKRNDKSGAMDVANTLLEEAKKENEDTYVARAANLLGRIAVENANYPEGLRLFRLVAEMGETAEERAAAYRAMADISILQSDFAGAYDAYSRAADVSGDYVSVYLGEIGRARMLSKLGKHEESLSLLGTLIKNSNYREFFAEIDLALANVYRDEADYASAEAQYRYVDTAYAHTEIAANAYYELGQLYETHLLNYDSARVAYEKGKGEFPLAAISSLAYKRGEYFSRYVQHRSELKRNDSLLTFIASHPPPEVQPDSAKNVAVQDTTKEKSKETIATIDSTMQKPLAIPPPPIDTVMARLAYHKSEMASLFYSGIGVLDSAKYWYHRLLTDHPQSPYAPRALFTMAQIYRADSTNPSSRVDSIYYEIAKRFPESEFAVESRQHLGLPEKKKEIDVVEAKYQEAEALTKRGEITAALRSLKEIAQKDSASPLAAKAQYTVGWIFENVKPNADSSIANYQKLVSRFPSSRYAALVQPKLAEVESEKQKKLQDAQRDSLHMALPDSNAVLNKNPDGASIVPPMKSVRKDSVMDETPIIKEQPKKDEEPPKP